MSEHQHHHHGHGHVPAADFDWDALAAHLEREAELRAPAVTAAAQWLRDLPGGGEARRVLDVGSGPGVIAGLLAEVFPDAEVVAVDQSAALLERARTRSGGRLNVQQADLPDEFGKLGEADLIWSANAIHHLGDQQTALTALAGRLRPGGLLAVAERGLPLRYLPRDFGLGRPGFQARLDAAHEDGFSTMRAELPGATEEVEDWTAMLGRAGLTPSGTRTFLVDHPAPLARPAREHLHAQLSRLRDQLADHLDPEDATTLAALLDEHAPTGILHRQDAFFLSAMTVHTARALPA
ncbi:trans-aconitate 2-methyltransferase [Kitasatospora aureofaciens]|uniref:class I SAM-dependent methyltransferase n=1 Tax=Kitasatospora aureofaciens TaxID=1894 RepID=UPI001C48BCAC|nr:class I SAM-dependent methyltransferase [Kitasatospora aureofaciens]MBV6700605.1 methyltransferase domain-containing protein [Kitasatospora aureofaciens]